MGWVRVGWVMGQGVMGQGGGGSGQDGSGWDGSGWDVKPDWWPEGLKSEFKDYYPSRSSQKDNETVIQAILNHYGEQNSNVEIPYQVIDNHVVFNIPGGSDNLENIMYPIENLDNVVEREINLNDM